MKAKTVKRSPVRLTCGVTFLPSGQKARDLKLSKQGHSKKLITPKFQRKESIDMEKMNIPHNFGAALTKVLTENKELDLDSAIEKTRRDFPFLYKQYEAEILAEAGISV